MNLNQVQILEYALQCFFEIHEKKNDNKINFHVILESKNDVFQAESYLKGSMNSPVSQRLNYEKEVVNESFSPNSYSSSPFQTIRSKVYDFFTTDWGPANTMSLVENPHILLKNLLNLIEGIDINTSENAFWYNYQSLKYDYSIAFKIIDPTEEFSIISLSLQN
ncbi:hypothetical protein ACE4ZH_15090 [Enterococcus casseliflavus]|uniref:hypothetical protein n=1 Tax=Enterococcus casseliflavus TaxID=37734 RepID=UPI0035CC9EDE